MKYNFKILQKIQHNATDRARYAINAGLLVAKDGIDSRTPEREGELLENNTITPAEHVGNKVAWKVYNTTPYGIIVEKGIRGRIYKYRKPRGFVFYVGQGARMFSRTAKEDKNKILQAIKSKIWKTLI